MALHYTLAYNLLFAELATFLVLIIPYPYAIRKRLFQFLSKSTIVATIGSALKISFLVVGALFVDAVQHHLRDAAAQPEHRAGEATLHYQRNAYLTCFHLFLTVVLIRTFSLTADFMRTREDFEKLEKEAAARLKEIKELKQKLADDSVWTLERPL